MREKINLGFGWFVYADAKPPFTVEVFKSGCACVLDSLGRNHFHTARGGVLMDPVSAHELAADATSIFEARKK